MYGSKRKRRLHSIAVLLGPVSFVLTIVLLEWFFGFKQAAALGTAVWMALWWILRPVNISVTAFVPIAVNALFDLVPMQQIISQYFSEIIVLLFGADLVCLTWATTGLDKRLAIKTLCCIGTSMKQQIAVWLIVSTVLSIFLPNVVVCTIMVPVAVSMLQFLGEGNIQGSKLAVPILLAIVWGAGIGGFGSPLGGAANLVAISYLEKLTGQEFMYIDWVVRFLPFLVLVLLLNLLFLFHLPLPVKRLAGSREYFTEMYAQLGQIRLGEKISLVLFAAATLLAFIRPLFAEWLPALKPAYVFLIIGLTAFTFEDEDGKALLTWEFAEKGVMWGMLFLFAGGLALGSLVTETGRGPENGRGDHAAAADRWFGNSICFYGFFYRTDRDLQQYGGRGHCCACCAEYRAGAGAEPDPVSVRGDRGVQQRLCTAGVDPRYSCQLWPGAGGAV